MVSSERIPNESYAQRAKKASTSSTPRTTLQKPPSNVTLSITTTPSSSLKPPQLNVWAERSQQKATTVPQPPQMPRQRATSSPQLSSDDAIQLRSPPTPPELSTQLAILDRQDEHDPFVVRVPPHLSRQSSSRTSPVPAADPTMWPHLSSADSPQLAPTTNDSPLVSAPPSRQNSAASFPHITHAHSSSGGSVHLSRVHSSFSQHSRSASQSRVQSRSGSSTSSPHLQFRPRALPQDDPIPPDPRSDHHLRRSSNKRSSPQLLDPSFPIDSAPPPADPPYYPRPPVPPLPDMTPCFPHNFVSHYALPPQFSLAHVPGHASPPYIPHSGQGTPPYSHYPPYPAYMYPHPSLFWHDVSPHAHFQSINKSTPPNTFDATEHPALHKMEFGSVLPAITTEPSTSKDSAQVQDTWQPKTSKGVIFGTTDLPESRDKPNVPPTNDQNPTDAAVEHATEQFATFSIGVTANEPGPSRFASRKSSVRSLSKLVISQLPTNDVAKDDHNVPPQGVNGIKKLVKWEFGSTLSEDLDNPLPSSPPSQTSQPPPVQQNKSSAEVIDDQPEELDITPSEDLTRSTYSMAKSDTESSTSDVWVVKDYGYGFGDYSGSGNAPNVVRREMREREKQRVRENYREREMVRDQLRDRAWVPPRQQGWRLENGVDDGREGWEQQVQNDVQRHGRPRRGSLPTYGHDRGGFLVRRGRGFGGRYHGGRGRGSFFHQRFGSYPYAPPAPPPPPLPPFELSPRIDMVNGYGQPHYVPPEVEPYEAVVPQSAIPFTPTAYSVDAMRNCLLAQLEYYLSPQNMAQDLYLRQRMDNEGWIPISLLASFKRVQQLHTDSEVVKGVLSQSRLVEVSGDWVRMGGGQWEVFVLPNAPKSTAKEVDYGQGYIHGPGPYSHDGDAHEMFGEVEGEHGETEGDYDGEDCEADEEEDDVEFVIGEEAEGRWMPVPERKP